jgi:hypothetical protein
MVMVRRTDGRPGLASREEAREHAERCRVEFEAARQLFAAAFSRKEREAGVEAAWQDLEAALRRPLNLLVSRAEAYEAAFVLASLLGATPESRRTTKNYSALLPAMTAQVRATLLDSSADSELQRVLLAALGGVSHQFHFEARDAGTVDGERLIDLAAPAKVALLTDSPLITPGPAPKSNPAVSALANTLWTVARDHAASPLVRAGAVLALARSGAENPREQVLQLAVDEDSDVRRGALYLITLRTDRLSAPEFLSLLDSQQDPINRSLAIRSLGSPLAGDPLVRDALVKQATAPVPADGVTTPQYFERRAALVALLEGFAESRDPVSLQAVASHADRWASEVWTSTSPLVILAEEASRLKLKEFLPYLRAASPLVPAVEHRRRVEEAVAALGP